MEAVVTCLTIGGSSERLFYQEDNAMEQNDESPLPAAGGSPSAGSIHAAGKPNFLWSLSAACLLCILAAVFGSPRKLAAGPDLMPYLLGGSIGKTIVLFGLFYFISWRKNYPNILGGLF